MIYRLLFFTAVSLVFHYFLLGMVPQFDIKLNPPKRIVEVELVPPSVKELPPAPAAKTGSSAVSKNARENIAAAPAVTIPDVDIPDVKDTQKLDLKIPKLKLSKLENNSTIKPDKELLKELKSTSDEFRKANKAGEGIVSDVTGKDSNAKDFFVIRNLNRNRKLERIPEKPVYSLTTDTVVRVEFKIDREGNTYAIILKNSTDSKIERLAIDFVKKLKFNAVLDSKPETAEILLDFRVR